MSLSNNPFSITIAGVADRLWTSKMFDLLTLTQLRLAIFLVALSTSSIDLVVGVELPSADQRFDDGVVPEVPDFRKHVSPLFGRLGCNGRACHGSFQGQGGFRLSLFGYDFDADSRAVREGDSPRISLASPVGSLLLHKPTHEDEHGGGERMKVDSWEYRLLRRWIESGAKYDRERKLELTALTIEPREVVFLRDSETRSIRVTAAWSDGTSEDVTPLCRFQINDESIATVGKDGVIISGNRGDTHLVVFYDHRVAVSEIIRAGSSQVSREYPNVPLPTRIDELVDAKLRKLGIIPSSLCTDSQFLRRVSLDVTGTLPTPDEIRNFIADISLDKRSRKIEELLGRSTYVARWSTKLCDLTGNSPRHFQDQAPPEEYARDWYAWIARRVTENIPYDQIVEGIVLGRSRRVDQTYDEYVAEQSSYYRHQDPSDFTSRDNMPYFWAKHNMRTPEERSLGFSYSFLGVRIECAQCHKHPFDRWTQDDFKGFMAFFEAVGFGVPPTDRKTHQAFLTKLGDQGNQAQRERARLTRAQRGEIVPWQEVYIADVGSSIEKGKVTKNKTDLAPRVLGGLEVNVRDFDDPRRPLMNWLRDKENPYFAKAFVNRVWSEYFGVGIIHPTDDLNQANPPSNAALLDYLVERFIEHGYDMKWLHREIVKSDAYQRSMATNDTNDQDEKNFSRSLARRLPAAILFDAIEQATSDHAQLQRATVDVAERAIGPTGGAFVGRWSGDGYASKVFGRSDRMTLCDCSASNEPNLLQAIYMQNDKDLLAAIDRQKGWLQEIRKGMAKQSKAVREKQFPELIEEVFLRTVSRLPTASETEKVMAGLFTTDDPIEGFREVLWSLLNMREFLTNH